MWTVGYECHAREVGNGRSSTAPARFERIRAFQAPSPPSRSWLCLTCVNTRNQTHVPTTTLPGRAAAARRMRT